MAAPYRWNAEKVTWEFYEPAFGGWTTLRVDAHVTTRPMTFREGIEHLVIHPLSRGREHETGWLRDAVRVLDIRHFPVREPTDEGAMENARNAWREYAEHAAGCVECGETSWENCDDGPHGPGGRTLRAAAITADALTPERLVDAE